MGRFAIIHAHTQHSLLDSPTSVPELVDAAIAAGAQAVAVTDHGTCTGWIEFMACCAEKGIKGIPGVEAYIRTPWAKRAHLVLLPKNPEGYREISRFVTDGNRTQERLYRNAFVPVSDMRALGLFFGHGNVIATTACISGPAGSIILGQDRIRAEIAKQEKALAAHASPEDGGYLFLLKERERLEGEAAALAERRDALKKTAERKFAARLKGLKGLEGGALIEARAAIDRDMAETEAAGPLLEEAKRGLAAKRAERTRLNGKIREMEADIAKHEAAKRKLEELKERELTPLQAQEAVDSVLESLKSVFGGDLYAEVQYHGLDQEKRIYPLLAERARRLGIPLVASNDAHIASEGRAEARQFLRAMRFEKWEDASPADLEMRVKGEAEQKEALMRILPEELAEEAARNTAAIADACAVPLPGGEHYPRHGSGDPAALLRARAEEGIPRLFGEGEFDEGYRRRLDRELETIHELGYDDYMLITEENARFAAELARGNDPDGIGYGTGPGRGSAAGSLTAYLLGITKVDPVKHGLIFERFLNRERVSSPDVDLDFSFEVREAAITRVKERYGEECVAAIRTAVKQTAKAAVHNSARVRGYELYPAGPGRDRKEAEEGRRRIARIGDAVCRRIPDRPGTRLSDLLDGLYGAFGDDEDAMAIIRRAADAEGAVTAMGTHPAGIVVSDGKPLSEYVPLLYSRAEGAWCVQCDMAEAEDIGLLKMDFLGLNTLDVITECVRRVKRDFGVTVDPDRIPYEEDVFEEIYAKGDTGCVFQVESPGMRNILRTLRPGCIEDVILAIAAYRPGPMELIPEIARVKNGGEKPRYALRELEGILSVTYGQPVYQEQLMSIFHECAGFSLGEADIVRRFMAKKKAEGFLSYRQRFLDGVTARGASREEAEGLWDSLADFAHYAFNKSHAAAYAALSYKTAWLKLRYPVQYMAAVLNHPRGADRLPGFLQECANMGIRVLPPDINLSSPSFEPEGGGIRFGLGAVKNVGAAAQAVALGRAADGPFRDIADFMLRCPVNSRAAKSLIMAGAFDRACPGGAEPGATKRGRLLRYYAERAPLADKIRKKRRSAALAAEAAAAPGAPAAERKKAARRAERLEDEIAECEEAMAEEPPGPPETDRLPEILAWERELLGAYVTARPLDEYRWVYADRSITPAASAWKGCARYAGLARRVRVTKRKSDGSPMAFFTLEDPSGTLEAVCFAKEYARYGELIRDGSMLIVSGRVLDDGSEEGGTLRLAARTVERCENRTRFKIVAAYGEDDFREYMKTLREKPGGYEVLLFDRTDPSGHLKGTGFMAETGDTVALPRREPEPENH